MGICLTRPSPTITFRTIIQNDVFADEDAATTTPAMHSVFLDERHR